jgi:hypothetical protein
MVNTCDWQHVAIDEAFLGDYSKLPKPVQNSVKTAIDKFAFAIDTEHAVEGFSAAGQWLQVRRSVRGHVDLSGADVVGDRNVSGADAQLLQLLAQVLAVAAT